MKNKFLTVLLTLLAPLAAQAKLTSVDAAEDSRQLDANRPISRAPSLGFEVNRYDGQLGMLVRTPVYDPDAMVIITANCTGETVTIAGFPLLLVPHAVILVAPHTEGDEFKIPFTGLPCDLYLQAGALVHGNILVSGIRMVGRDG